MAYIYSTIQLSLTKKHCTLNNLALVPYVLQIIGHLHIYLKNLTQYKEETKI